MFLIRNIVFFFALYAGVVSAQGVLPQNARYLAANCANCHGTNGVGAQLMPSLAGLNKEYLIEQMQAFKTGKRAASIMHQLSKGYSDEQIAAVSAFFEQQK